LPTKSELNAANRRRAMSTLLQSAALPELVVRPQRHLSWAPRDRAQVTLDQIPVKHFSYPSPPRPKSRTFGCSRRADWAAGKKVGR
jgi:hypothetical protein